MRAVLGTVFALYVCLFVCLLACSIHRPRHGEPKSPEQACPGVHACLRLEVSSLKYESELKYLILSHYLVWWNTEETSGRESIRFSSAYGIRLSFQHSVRYRPRQQGLTVEIPP